MVLLAAQMSLYLLNSSNTCEESAIYWHAYDKKVRTPYEAIGLYIAPSRSAPPASGIRLLGRGSMRLRHCGGHFVALARWQKAYLIRLSPSAHIRTAETACCTITKWRPFHHASTSCSQQKSVNYSFSLRDVFFFFSFL